MPVIQPTSEPADVLVRAKLIEQHPGDICVCIEVGTKGITQQFWASRAAVIFEPPTIPVE